MHHYGLGPGHHHGLGQAMALGRPGATSSSEHPALPAASRLPEPVGPPESLGPRPEVAHPPTLRGRRDAWANVRTSLFLKARVLRKLDHVPRQSERPPTSAQFQSTGEHRVRKQPQLPPTAEQFRSANEYRMLEAGEQLQSANEHLMPTPPRSPPTAEQLQLASEHLVPTQPERPSTAEEEEGEEEDMEEDAEDDAVALEWKWRWLDEEAIYDMDEERLWNDVKEGRIYVMEKEQLQL